MPVVQFKRKTLEKLVGKKLTEEELRNEVPMIGCDLETINEEEVEYEVFPDRPDMLSTEGFARAIKYYMGIDKGMKKYPLKDSGVKLDKQNVKARPKIVAAIAKEVHINDETLRSLMQVQEKIHKTFGRERKKIAIGIHDLNKIKPPFTYKQVNPNKYSFTPLGWEKELTLKQIREKHEKGRYADILQDHEEWPVITDREGYTLSFPPVINGRKTELTTETENIFIDVTGTDQEAIEKALNIVTTSLAERKAEIYTVEITGDGKKPNLEPEKIKVKPEYIEKLIGEVLTEKDIKKYLEGMGFEYNKGEVLVPPYRADIMHPIDIVEEVAVKCGYDKITPSMPKVATTAKPNKERESQEKVKNLVVGLGYQEVKNPILTNQENHFERMQRSKDKVVELENPLTKDYSICRRGILHQVLQNLSKNQHEPYPQKIFELGHCLTRDKKEELGVKTLTKLTLTKTDNEVNYNEATATLDAVLRNLGASYELRKSRDPSFIPGRRASIISRGREVGVVGEVHPKVLNNFGVEKPVIAIELLMENIIK